jgi:3',5'-cyclic-AMP phosphodiesterase
MLIAQISDIHVCSEGQLYKGVANSNQMLIDAIDHLHKLDVRPDLVLVTGDLVDEGRIEEYAMAVTLLNRLQIPYFVMPGNHDHRENLVAAFAKHHYLPRRGPLHYCVDDYPVRIVALDCCPPGQHFGAIDQAGLNWLETTLGTHTDRPTLILMHHPPFASGIGYLDEYRYLNPEPLKAIIERYRNIDAILVGHVHRSMVNRWAGTVVLSCPSTTTEIALQLRPDAKPQSFIGPPACMLHYWKNGQGLVSHTSHIGQYDGPFNFF